MHTLGPSHFNYWEDEEKTDGLVKSTLTESTELSTTGRDRTAVGTDSAGDPGQVTELVCFKVFAPGKGAHLGQ